MLARLRWEVWKMELLHCPFVHCGPVANVDNVDNTDNELEKCNEVIIQVRSLQQGAPPGLDDVLLKVSSWGDPSQVCRMFWRKRLYSFNCGICSDISERFFPLGICPLLPHYYCLQLPQRHRLPRHLCCQRMDKYGIGKCWRSNELVTMMNNILNKICVSSRQNF